MGKCSKLSNLPFIKGRGHMDLILQRCFNCQVNDLYTKYWLENIQTSW